MTKRSEFRWCSGKRLTGRKLPCRFRAYIEYRDKWYCKKCYNVVTGDRAHQEKLPPTVLSLKDLQQLSDELKEYRIGGIDSSSAETLVLEIMPLLLSEVLKARGAKS